MTALRVIKEGAIASQIQAALAAQKAVANGVAPLDGDAKVPAANSRVESVAGRTGAVVLGVGDVSGAVSDADARLSNARTPTAHRPSHVFGSGSDALSPADVGAIAKAGDSGVTPFTLTRDPNQALEPATMQYVDAARAGLDTKLSVRLASNTNHVLTGAQTVDGVAVVTGNRILLKNQTNATENGIWIASTTGAWTRATDANTSARINAGMFTFIEEGTSNADTGWVLTTDDPITLGTTALVFGQFSGPGSTTAGTGLVRSGNQLSADFGTGSGKVTQGNDSRLSDARTPTSHRASHAQGGSDALSAADVGAIGRVRDEGTLVNYAAELDFLGAGVTAVYNATTGRIEVSISGASAGAATETVAGITQQATAQQIIDGVAGNLFATVARLKAELDRRATPEAWRVVGAAGQPAFQNGWSSLAGSTVAFRKEPSGAVRLRSLAVGGTISTTTTGTIFTLPAGYRPIENQTYAVMAGGNAAARCDVLTDGSVKAVAGGTNGFWALSGVSFYGEQ